MTASGIPPWVPTREGNSCRSWVMQPGSTPLRHFNDESPLGLRRILSQSTDSLNMRNRTLSVESLIDEGDCARTSGRPGHEGQVGAVLGTAMREGI